MKCSESVRVLQRFKGEWSELESQWEAVLCCIILSIHRATHSRRM